MISRRPTLATLLLLTASTAYAAPKSPVHWSSKPVPSVKAGSPLVFHVDGVIDPGWHVYALEEPDGGPIATVVGLTEGDPADLLRVTEDPPIQFNDPLFHLTTGLHRGSISFTLHLRVDKDAKPGPTPLHVLVRYQSCDDHVCLPPHTDTVEVPITVIH